MSRKKLKVTALKTWQFQDDTTENPQTTKLRNPSDVEFLNDTDFIVCDSDLHCLHLFRKHDRDVIGKDGEIEDEKDDGNCENNGNNNSEIDGSDDNENSNKNSAKSLVDSTLNGDSSLKGNSSNDASSYDGRGYDHSVLLQEQMWPSCLVVTKDGKVRLSDRKNKSVKTYDIERQEMVSEWRDDKDGKMIPHGVAVTSSGESIVTDAKNNVVWVLGDQGQHLRSFGSEGDLLDQFRLPFYACVDTKDNILISDNMNYCVKTFDTQGNFLIRIGSGHLFGQRKFQSPYGLTYDGVNNEILVADSDTNRIFTYDDQGTFLRYAVSGAECESPCGLSIRGDHLVVTLSSPDRCNVKLFQLESN